MWNWIKHRIRRKVEPRSYAKATGQAYTFTLNDSGPAWMLIISPHDWRFIFRGGGCE